MKNKNPKVDAFLSNAKQWRKEMEKLRGILLDHSLTEELKWGLPCYVSGKSNVAILQDFKENCALMFFQGALLEDPDGLLEKPGDNSRSARRVMFTDVKQIAKLESKLKAFIRQAIEAEKDGLKVDLKEEAQLEPPEEFAAQLKKNPALKRAFAALTPGRQRAYLLFFSAPKQSKTRTSRIEKNIDRILDGKGIND